MELIEGRLLGSERQSTTTSRHLLEMIDHQSMTNDTLSPDGCPRISTGPLDGKSVPFHRCLELKEAEVG